MDDLRGVRGVCFDLWNTLAYTDHDPHPITALARAFGLEGAPGWRARLEAAFMTRRLPGVSAAIDALAAATGREPAGGWSRRDLVLLWGRAALGNRLFPDALPALRALARGRAGRAPYRLALVSNTQSFDLDVLRREGLEPLLDAQVLSCDCGLLKPEPAIFDLAASRLGLPPSDVLMVGDSPSDDVEAARRAGLRALLLDRSGARPDALGLLSDLPALLSVS